MATLTLGRGGAARSDDRFVIALVGTAHGGSHFFHLVLPALFPWLTDAFAVSAMGLGLVMAVYFAVSGVGQAVVGVYVDRLGAARVLTVGLALLGLGALIAATATGLLVLIAAALVMALGNCTFHPADYAILGHRVAPARLGRAFAIHTLGGSIGWALAPVTMAAVATFAGWRAALVVAALIALALAWLVHRSRERLATPLAAGGGAAFAGYLRLVASRPILLCFAFFAAQAVSLIGLQSFMPLVFETTRGIDPLAANATVTAFMTGSALGTLAGGYLADFGHNLRRTIALGLAASAVLAWGLGLEALPFALVYPLASAAGALQGVTTPSRDLLVRANAPPGTTGQTFGFVYSGLDLGATLGPLLMGALFDAGWPRLIFTGVAGFILLSGLFALLIPERPPPAGGR